MCKPYDNDIHDHDHRLMTSTVMTSNDNDDKEYTSLQNPGAKNVPKAPSFQMVAKPSTTMRSDDINHPLISRPLLDTSPCLLRRDPHEFPDTLWISPLTSSPSSSSGGHPPSATYEQLDHLYEPMNLARNNDIYIKVLRVWLQHRLGHLLHRLRLF